MTLSLRQRVLVWIVLIYIGAFAVEFALFGESVVSSTSAQDKAQAGELVSMLRVQIQPGGGLNAARILQWRGWERFDDAILLDRNLSRESDGAVRPLGIALNPLGSGHRPADFDYDAIYRNIALSVDKGLTIDDVAGGSIMPIDTERGVWGACWYHRDPSSGITPKLVRSFLVLLLVSTFLVAATLFVVLRRGVLDPITRLTRCARRVAEGDLSARVEVPAQDDELAELSRTFNAMVSEVQGFKDKLDREVQAATHKARDAEQAAMAERRLAATGKLAAGIAHEINNPLGGLLNAVERLRRDDLPPQKRTEYFALLAGGLERIRDTVGKLLRFTPRGAQHAPLHVSAPILDAVGLVRHRATRAGVAISISDGLHASEAELLPEELARSVASLPRVLGDPNEIGQALLNLLVNSLDALESGATQSGRIEVVLRSGYEPGLGAALLIDVHDNGPGIGREELGKVLDLFYTTKEVGKGTGLGLAMVHSVVRAHGGKLELDSAPGRGFHVRIALPVLEAAREAR